MHRARAPEREQGEAPRVDASLHRHHPQRPDHLLVGNADDPLGGLDRLEAERPRELVDARRRRLVIEGDAAGQGGVRGQVPEQEVGVGDGGLAAAPPVAGRAGVGARRPGADAKGAARIPPADRAAACSDRVHVDHRQLDRTAVDLPGVGAAHLAALDHADIARRTSHVETKHVLDPGGAGERCGADRASGGSRENAPGARARGLGGGRGATRGPHHLRLGDSALAACLGQPIQVAAEQGGEVGVDHGGRAALVFAELGQDLMRGGDVESGQRRTQRGRDPGLVPIVGEREQQADRD